MKIVLSSHGKNKDELVDVKFGRCKYFAIYEDGIFSYVENTGRDSNEGAGVGATQLVLDLNPDVLITERLGPNAFEALSESKIKILKCHGMSLEDAVNRFYKNKLDGIDKAYR